MGTYKLTKRLLSVAVIGAAVLGTSSLTAPSTSTAQAMKDKPTYGGIVNSWLRRDPGGFDLLGRPTNTPEKNTTYALIHARLFDLDPVTNKPIPWLAESATPSDDFKRWKIKLREDIKFSDGSPMTAEDWKFHFDRLLGSKFGNRYRGIMGPRLDHVEQVDKYRFEFVFSEASPGFQTLLSYPNIAWSVSPAKWLKANANNPDLNSMALGAGPYMLKEWRDDASGTLVANPHYFDKKKQYLKAINFLVISNISNAFNAAKAGQIDYMNIPPWLLKKAKSEKGLKVITGPAPFAGLAVSWNQQKPPFDDIRIRRALIHALDRDPLAATLTRVPQKAPWDMYHDSSPWHCKPELKYPEYSVEKAKELIAEYVKEKGSIGELKFTMVPFKDLLRVAAVFQDFWKQVGLNVKITPGPRGPGYNRSLLARKHDFFWVNLGQVEHPSVVTPNFHSKHRDNFYGVKDATIDAALEAVRAARSEAETYKASCSFQKALVDQSRLIMWRIPTRYEVHTTKIKGATIPYGNHLQLHRIWVGKS